MQLPALEHLQRVWDRDEISRPITATEKSLIFYDKPVFLGRYADGGTIKPDYTMCDKEKKKVKVIEVSVPEFGPNTAKRKKITKY